jgi:hypothetical protein
VRVDSLLAEYTAFAELLTGDDGVAEKWTQLIMDAFNNIDNGSANDSGASMFTVQVGNLASSDPAKFKLPLISLLLNADLVPAHFWDLWFPYYAQPAPLVGKYAAIAEAFGVTVEARKSVPASAVARLTDKAARPARGAADRVKDVNEFQRFKAWRESQKAIAWTTEIAPPDAVEKKTAFYDLVTEQLRLNPLNRKQFQVAVSQAGSEAKAVEIGIAMAKRLASGGSLDDMKQVKEQALGSVQVHPVIIETESVAKACNVVSS